MITGYICDLCGTELEEVKEVGKLHLRGVNPVAKRGQDKYFSYGMDLCPPCSKAAYQALIELTKTPDVKTNADVKTNDQKVTLL
jgi:hypothetical protein